MDKEAFKIYQATWYQENKDRMRGTRTVYKREWWTKNGRRVRLAKYGITEGDFKSIWI